MNKSWVKVERLDDEGRGTGVAQMFPADQWKHMMVIFNNKINYKYIEHRGEPLPGEVIDCLPSNPVIIQGGVKTSK